MKKILLLLLGLTYFASCGGGTEPSSGDDDGMQRTYWDNGKLKSECRYVDGKLDGAYKTWYDNGQVFQDGQYADGMMDGSWLVFYPDGQLAARAQYNKGVGKQTGYNEEGCKIFEVTWLDNVKHGKEIRYAPNGDIVQIVEYEHGEKVSEERGH